MQISTTTQGPDSDAESSRLVSDPVTIVIATNTVTNTSPSPHHLSKVLRPTEAVHPRHPRQG